MRKQGTVFRWDAAKGFGFIRSIDTDQDIFFHVRDYRGNSAPGDGERVWFEEIHVGGKGPRGMSVTPLQATGAPLAATPSANRHNPPGQTNRPVRPNARQSRSDATSAHPLLILPLMLAWVALIAWGVTQKRLPLWAVGAAIALNIVTFFYYAHDKNAARNRRWRVSESTLHMLSLLGGWPFAWLAQQTLRHKSSKLEFRTTYRLTVALHFAALLGWVFWKQLQILLNM
jgi:uncharacterized membrane protein YsdA (DUF1294 family)/cold shock CspA family protein